MKDKLIEKFKQDYDFEVGELTTGKKIIAAGTLDDYGAKQCTKIALEAIIEALAEIDDDSAFINNISELNVEKFRYIIKERVRKYQKQLEELKIKE